MSGDPEVLAHSGIGSRAVAHEERCSWLSREYLCARSQKKLRTVRHREGGYLLRTNLCGQDPAELWQIYIQLVDAHLYRFSRLLPLRHSVRTPQTAGARPHANSCARQASASSLRWNEMLPGEQWLERLQSTAIIAIAPFAAFIWALRQTAPTDLARTASLSSSQQLRISAMSNFADVEFPFQFAAIFVIC